MTLLTQVPLSGCLLAIILQATAVSSSNSLFCYYGTWAQWRLAPREIDPFLCTHILVGFADIWIQGRESTVRANITTDEQSGGVFAQLVGLKSRNPGLKVLLAVGGHSHGPERFHAVARDPALLRSFVGNTVSYLLQRGFDGIDIDWEYPSNKPDYTRLLRAFRAEIGLTGRRLLLVSAVSAGGWIIDRAYDVPVVQRLLDHVLLMAYDMHGLWGNPLVTGHNSPLYPRDGRPDDTLNLQWAANTWVSRGTPREKLVVGMPAYGRMFPLKDPADDGVGSPAEWWAPGFVPTPTFLQICGEFLPGAAVSWDPESKVPFASKDNLWLSFDNRRSLTIKTEWIVSRGFGGAMVWSMDNDDFGNVCGMGYSPLVTAVKSAMTRRLPAPSLPVTQLVTSAVRRTTPKPTASSELDCATEGSNSYHVIPGDCSHFVRCVWGKPRTQSCPPNLYFTPKGNNCNWKSIVRPSRLDCDWRTVS